MKMGNQNMGNLRRCNPGQQQLPLRAFTWVDQDTERIPANKQAIVVAVPSGNLAGGAEKSDLAGGHAPPILPNLAALPRKHLEPRRLSEGKWLDTRSVRGGAMQRRNRHQQTFLALSLLLFACGKNPEQKAAEIGKEVDAALSTQHWEQAEKKAQEILAIAKISDATRDQAKLKLEQAKSEQLAKTLYQKFSGAAGTDHDTAMAAFRDMAQGSYYRGLAKTEYERILPSYIEDHLEKANSASFNGRCADAKQQLQMVFDVDPQNQKAVELGKKPCPKKAE